MMKTEDYSFDDTRGARPGAWQRLGRQLARYLGSRGADHWIMFPAGAFVGALLG